MRFNFTWFLAGSFVGSLAGLLFDPARGNYRRALIRDKGISFKRSATKYAGKFSRDLQNRITGFKANFEKAKQGEEVDDETLKERVRSDFGRYISHPRAITASVRDGVVTFTGQILRHEVNELLTRVANISGVKEVINNLEVYNRDNNIPGLQGKGPEYLS